MVNRYFHANPSAGNFCRVESAFCPAAATGRMQSNLLMLHSNSHLARRLQYPRQPPGLGEPDGADETDDGEPREGESAAVRSGELPMQNAFLVGLSRQVALSRELDVVANNIANINTTGYKADGSLFEEYLRLDRPFGHRRPRQLRARPRHLARHEPGPDRAHRQSARRRHRRRRLPRGADAARRALHAQRRAADQRHRPTGHHRRRSGARQRRPDRVPAERPADLDQRRRHDQRRAKAPPRPTPRAASCASSPSPSRSNCRRTAAAPSSRGAGDDAAGRRATATHRAGRGREIERARRRRDVAHDRDHPRLHAGRHDCCSSRAT